MGRKETEEAIADSRAGRVSGRFATVAELLADLQRHVWPLFAEGRLKPQLERVYPAKDVDAAFAALASNQVAGKLVLQLDASLA